ESALPPATHFALGLAAHGKEPRAVLWVAEDMGLLENGAPYGPGLDDLGLSPARLVTVAAAKSRDVLWAMEEALRCRAVGVVIGQAPGADGLDFVASRRLPLGPGSGTSALFCCAPRRGPTPPPLPRAGSWLLRRRARAPGPVLRAFPFI